MQGCGVLICKRRDHSGTSCGDFCPCKPALLWLWEHTFPFLRRLNIASPWLRWKTEDFLREQSRTDQWGPEQPGTELSRPKHSRVHQCSAKQTGQEQSSAEQQRTERSCLAGEDPGLGPPGPGLSHTPAVSTAVLYHNWAILQLCYITIELFCTKKNFPLLSHFELGIFVGVNLELCLATSAHLRLTEHWLTPSICFHIFTKQICTVKYHIICKYYLAYFSITPCIYSFIQHCAFVHFIMCDFFHCCITFHFMTSPQFMCLFSH